MCIGGGGGYDAEKAQAERDKREREEDRAARIAAAKKRENEKAKAARIDAEQKQFMQNALDQARLEYGTDIAAYLPDLEKEFSIIEAGLGRFERPNAGTFDYEDLVEQNIIPELEGEAQDVGKDVLKDLYPSGWETERITGTADDAILAAINASEQQKAYDYIENLLARDVITKSGATAARTNVGEQSPGILAQLEALGSGAITTGRDALTGIVRNAEGQVADLGVGETFDPTATNTKIDEEYNRWLAGLENTIRGGLTGNLYNTSGLPVIAGAAGFAGNTAFDPKAIAGIFEEEEDEDTGESPARLASTSIF